MPLYAERRLPVRLAVPRFAGERFTARFTARFAVERLAAARFTARFAVERFAVERLAVLRFDDERLALPEREVAAGIAGAGASIEPDSASMLGSGESYERSSLGVS